MILEFTVIIGKNDKGKEQRWVYRVHNEELSRFLRDKQQAGQCIESGRCLFRKKLADVVSRHIIDNEEVNNYKTNEEIALKFGLDNTDFDGM